jgi:prephenate dehydrogenase
MNIGIVGLGLIGGTYAKSLRPYGYTIYGIDISEESLEYAKNNNIIDYGTTSAKEVLPKIDVLYLCLYPEATKKFMQANARYIKEEAVVSDVVGVKRDIISNLSMYYNDGFEIVYAHPIAGREKIGVTYSDANIFKDANYVITPTKHNTEEALNLIEVLARQMGFKNVSRISDFAHDEIIAFTSQLTHAIAIALVNSDEEHVDTSLFIGDSYKDLTRIAMINHELWTELFLKNKDNLLKKINIFEQHLDILKEALESKDVDKLHEIMKSATIKRKKIKS